MRKIIHISKLGLILILALQVLNLSIASQAYWDGDYDYSYAYNSKYDPTETAVEWIVEMNCGQQAAFSYDTGADTNKNTLKSLHWQIGLDGWSLPVHEVPKTKRCYFPGPDSRILSPSQETFSPPPESTNG